MNIDDLQTLWNSDTNSLGAAARGKILDRFMKKLLFQRRMKFVWLGWTILVLTAITVLAGRQILDPAKMDFAREWGAIPLLLVPWVLAFYFLNELRRPAVPSPRGDLAIVDALRTARQSIAAKQRALRTILFALLLLLPILAFSILELHSTGKVTSRDLFSMAAFFGGALGFAAIGITIYHHHLQPRRVHLEAALRQFAEAVE